MTRIFYKTPIVSSNNLIYSPDLKKFDAIPPLVIESSAPLKKVGKVIHHKLKKVCYSIYIYMNSYKGRYFGELLSYLIIPAVTGVIFI